MSIPSVISAEVPRKLGCMDTSTWLTRPYSRKDWSTLAPPSTSTLHTPAAYNCCRQLLRSIRPVDIELQWIIIPPMGVRADSICKYAGSEGATQVHMIGRCSLSRSCWEQLILLRRESSMTTRGWRVLELRAAVGMGYRTFSCGLSIRNVFTPTSTASCCDRNVCSTWNDPSRIHTVIIYWECISNHCTEQCNAPKLLLLYCTVLYTIYCIPEY